MATEMTRVQAVELAGTGWWEGAPARDVALAQLRQSKLCMGFGDFHRVVELAIGRPVFTHEFADPIRLVTQIVGK
jgi:hypothetical protein